MADSHSRRAISALSTSHVWKSVCCLFVLVCQLGANYRTENFLVSAPTAQLAREVGEAAERYRRELANQWLGQELEVWGQPCAITVEIDLQQPAGGYTSYELTEGKPADLQMSVSGGQRRILHAVLPHEVLHTVLASKFGAQLPPWLEEGICVTAEDQASRNRLERSVQMTLTRGRTESLADLLATTQYPDQVFRFYGQGYSLAKFLIERGGRSKLVEYMVDAVRDGDWSTAIRTHYGYESIDALQHDWSAWVRTVSTPAATAQNPVARNLQTDSR